MKKRISKVLMSMVVVAVFLGISSAGGTEAYVNDFYFSSLAGTWAMGNGTGIVSAGGNSGTMDLQNGTVWVSSLKTHTGDAGGSANIKCQSDWLLSRSGYSSVNFPLDFKTDGTFANTGINEYSLSYAGGTVSGNVVITLTSETSGTVTQTETDTSSEIGRAHV
jgi:hypothetical protein